MWSTKYHGTPVSRKCDRNTRAIVGSDTQIDAKFHPIVSRFVKDNFVQTKHAIVFGRNEFLFLISSILSLGVLLEQGFTALPSKAIPSILFRKESALSTSVQIVPINKLAGREPRRFRHKTVHILCLGELATRTFRPGQSNPR